MLNFETISLSQTNCYLLKAGNGYLLVDCGNAYDKEIFLSSLSKLGIDPTDIRYLFLTHHHSDHCGLLEWLLSANPQMGVVMSKKCAEYLKTGAHCKNKNERYSNPALGLIVGTYSRFSKTPLNETFASYFARSEDIVVECDNDTVFSDMNIDGRILFTPGHTEDSISIIADHVAFVGDAARNILNLTGTPYQPILIYDLEACHESWNKLINEGARLICPAHGKPFRAERISRLLNK